MSEETVKITRTAYLTETEKDELVKSVVEFKGHTSQLLKAIQELNELAIEVSHMIENRADKKEVMAEVADVEIMIKQVRYMLLNGADRIDYYRILEGKWLSLDARFKSWVSSRR